tara:strand:+ start:165 stop:278 length:114 start_codon:yes stop_codon:yes gene_type:complete
MAWTGSLGQKQEKLQLQQAVVIGVFIVIAFVMIKKLF